MNSQHTMTHVPETAHGSFEPVSMIDGTTNSAAEIKKRSVVIAGHRTSISLENAFWDALRRIAASRGASVNQLVTEIDRDRQGNLSSAIRTHVLLTSQAHGR